MIQKSRATPEIHHQDVSGSYQRPVQAQAWRAMGTHDMVTAHTQHGHCTLGKIILETFM